MREPVLFRVWSGWLAARHTLAWHRGHHRSSRRWAEKAVTS